MTTIQRILGLLDADERRDLLALLPLVIVMALLEVVGIASVAPFLSLVGDPSLVHEQGLLGRAYDVLGFTDTHSFLILLGGASLAALVISNAFSAFMIWRLRNFANMRGSRMSTRLLWTYLSRSYAFFLGRNSSELTRNILTEVATVVNGVLMPGLQLLAKGVATVFIVALVFSVDPVLAVVAFTTFGGMYVLIFQIVKAQLARVGRERLEANAQRFKSANEAIGAVKDLKVMGRDDHYKRRFQDAAENAARATTRSQVIAQAPRYALETVAFGGVLVVVIALLGVGRGLDQILPVIGVYAFAVYRLMPSLQTVFTSVASIRYNLAALDAIAGDFDDAHRSTSVATPVDNDGTDPLAFERLIEMRHVRYQYPGSSRTTLEDVSLAIAANSMVAFVGPTGAGKSTLVDLLLGLLEPDEGELLVDGVVVGPGNVRRWQKNLGYVSQHIFLADDTVTVNIALGVPAEKIDVAAVERAARAAQLHEFVETELKNGYETLVGDRGIRLSGGQRQRIGIARALYHDPKVLVFDEATSALDSVTEKDVFHAIEALKGKKTIAVIAHRLSTVEACDQLFLVDGGRLVRRGTYAQLLEEDAGFRRLAGHGS